MEFFFSKIQKLKETDKNSVKILKIRLLISQDL